MPYIKVRTSLFIVIITLLRLLIILFHLFLPCVDQVPMATAKDISKKQWQQVLHNNSKDFIRLVPVNEILSELKREKVLSKRDVTDIKNKKHHDEKVELLYDIFYYHREANDFLILCRLLKENQVETIQKFGKKMKKELKNFTA